MVDLAFGIAKRHLGVMISSPEDDILLYAWLKRYLNNKKLEKKIERQQISKEKARLPFPGFKTSWQDANIR